MDTKMPRLSTLIIASLTLITSLACMTLLGGASEPELAQPVIPETSFIVTPTPENLSCPAITETIVYLNSPQEIESTDFSTEEDEESYIVTYVIENDQLTDPDFPPISLDLQDEREDTAKHQEIWNYFIALIPYEHRTHLGEFTIMTDGEGNILPPLRKRTTTPEVGICKWISQILMIITS